jgi:hypothetical protein
LMKNMCYLITIWGKEWRNIINISLNFKNRYNHLVKLISKFKSIRLKHNIASGELRKLINPHFDPNCFQ